jgi:ribosomal protein S18 acetylase RimI-like enzyme
VPEPPRLSPTRVWYLALDELRPAREPGPEAAVVRAEVPLGALNRFFYVEVGRDFHWVDRLGWTAGHWQAHAERTETWLLLDRGTPAGYAELEGPAILMLGLLEPFRGRGLGGHLLTAVARRAQEHGGTVTVDTCELDGPHALRAYEARGFRVVREAVEPRGRSA